LQKHPGQLDKNNKEKLFRISICSMRQIGTNNGRGNGGFRGKWSLKPCWCKI